MIKCSVFLFSFLLFISSINLHGQEAAKEAFTPEEWSSINHRWIRMQPAIMLRSRPGIQYSGQPLHASEDTLYILPSTSLPLGSEEFKDLQQVPFHAISTVLLQKGGNSFTRSRKSVRLVIPESDKFYTSPFQAVRNASVYVDSMSQPRLLEEAFKKSKVLRQVFPDKRFRLSIGFSMGAKRAEKDAMDALINSPLPYPEGGYGSPGSLDILDVSWRFLDRFIVGGQIMARNFSSSIYDSYNFTGLPDISYRYEIYFNENSLYAEYAFMHLDRYFTRRFELLAGAGFLMGNTEQSVYYNFNDELGPDNWVSGEDSHAQEGKLYGVQIRGAFHYYFFPGLSLYAGLEGNLYGPWIVEAVELPTSNPDSPLLLQEHRLNFSGIRFKMGVSIYL